MKNILLIFIIVSFLTGTITGNDGYDHERLKPDTILVVTSFSLSERVPVVISHSNMRYSQKQQQHYKLRDCNAQDPEGACYFTVGMNSSITTRGNTATQICYFSLKNSLGIELARLEQRVAIKYHNGAGGLAKLPATALTGNLNGTYTNGIYANWVQTGGATVSPGWGIKVRKGGLLASVADGLLDTWVPLLGFSTGTHYIAINLHVDDNSTRCF